MEIQFQQTTEHMSIIDGTTIYYPYWNETGNESKTSIDDAIGTTGQTMENESSGKSIFTDKFIIALVEIVVPCITAIVVAIVVGVVLYKKFAKKPTNLTSSPISVPSTTPSLAGIKSV